MSGQVQKYLVSQGFQHPDVRELYVDPLVYSSNLVGKLWNRGMGGLGFPSAEAWQEHKFSFDTGNGRRAICSFEISSVPWYDSGVPNYVRIKTCEMDDHGRVPAEVVRFQHGW